jgi:hypothetical protein
MPDLRKIVPRVAATVLACLLAATACGGLAGGESDAATESGGSHRDALADAPPLDSDSEGSAGSVTTTLVSGRGFINIVVDPSNIYASATPVPREGPSQGVIVRMGLDGGALITLGQQQGAAWSLAINGLYAYWTSKADLSRPWPSLERALLDGGAPKTLAIDSLRKVGLGGGPMGSALAVDSEHVYWTDDRKVEEGGVCGVLLRAELDGSRATTLATCVGRAVAPVGEPVGLAINATDAYWVNQDGVVGTVPLDGGAWRRLATEWGGNAIALDSDRVYWISGLAVMAVGLGGGQPTTLAKERVGFAIAVDESFVYWAGGRSPGRVMRVAKSGGTPITLASEKSVIRAIAVDNSSLYWGTATSLVRRTPK